MTTAADVARLDSMPPGYMLKNGTELIECPCEFCQENYHQPRREAVRADIRARVRESFRIQEADERLTIRI